MALGISKEAEKEIINNITDELIEDLIALEIYEVLSRQDFYDFYMSKSKKSFTAHIEARNNCPTKMDMIKELKILFNQVIQKAKEIKHAS